MDKANDHDGGREYWDSWRKKTFYNEHALSVLWKYHNRPQEELYDMEADPDELQNIIGDSKIKKLLEGYRKTLANWRKQQNDKLTGPEEIKEETLKKGTKLVAPYVF